MRASAAASSGTLTRGSRLGDARLAPHEQPLQRRRARARRGRPPGDDLALRPGERDVEQAQLLGVVLGLGLPLARVPARSALAADVEDPLPVGVVQPQRRRGGRAWCCPSRTARRTTGNSSPLLACTVTTCTAAASVSRRRLRSAALPLSGSSTRSASQVTSALSPSDCSTAARSSTCARWRRSVSRRSPCSCAEQPRLEPGLPGEVLERGGEPGLARSAERPRAAARRPRRARARGPRRARSARPAEQRGQRRQADPPGAVRLLDRLQQPQPVAGARRREHARAAGHHARDTGPLERRLHRARPARACGPAPRCRPAAPAAVCRPAARRRGRAGARRRRRRRRRPARAARPTAGKPFLPSGPAPVRAEHPQPQRCAGVEPRRGVRRAAPGARG